MKKIINYNFNLAHGIKEILIFGKIKNIVGQFNNSIESLREVDVKHNVVTSYPKVLLEQAGEKPIWVGKGDGADTSKTVILANEKTKSWTIVQFDKNMACVLGSGVSSQVIFTGPVI